MRVPLSWLREYVDLPAEVYRPRARRAADPVGLEVETVHESGAGLTGPLVVGQVLEIEELTGVQEADPLLPGPGRPGARQDVRGIVCGARNFAVGDLVVVALPGAVLPGDFKIAARKTYGHVSDGMICSARELGLGDDHAGIIVLPAGRARSAPTRSSCSASATRCSTSPSPRTAATACRCAAWPARPRSPTALRCATRRCSTLPAPTGDGYPVQLDDPTGCDRFVARARARHRPARAHARCGCSGGIQLAGMRPISLIVDVTNYVMLEIGQPLHAYDLDRLRRRRSPCAGRGGGEARPPSTTPSATLDPDDLLITDDSGPIGLAGVMGGASTEVARRHAPTC